MRKSASSAVTITGVLAIALGTLSIAPSVTKAADDKGMSAIDKGREVVSNRKKGNCMACHKIAGLKGRAAEAHGNIGPALVNMKSRYPDKSKLRDKIYDATATNPHTIMPPFGKNKILTKQELDDVVDFIYTL